MHAKFQPNRTIRLVRARGVVRFLTPHLVIGRCLYSDRIPLYSMRVATLIFSDAEMVAQIESVRKTDEDTADVE